MAENMFLKWAKWYLKKGFSVIPVRRDKKPLIEWEKYQKAKPNVFELNGWWREWPDAGIGIVTGKISNLAVIDVDTKEGENKIAEIIPDSSIYPAVITPSGGKHYYFTYPTNQILHNNTRAIPGCDLRAEGGYVVAPPSINGNGKRWQWLKDAHISKVEIPALPRSYLQVLSTCISTSTCTSTYAIKVPNSKDAFFAPGRRDNDLFHAANLLIKAGMDADMVEETLIRLAHSCILPEERENPERWARDKVKSALKRVERKERNLAQEVKDFVCLQDGTFCLQDVYRGLHLSTRNDKKNVSIICKRLQGEGLIEKSGKVSGVYRKLESDLEVMDWKNAPTDEFDIHLPLKLYPLVKIYPKNIIIIAGTSNSGKGHPEGTPILTPEGWCNIENLKVGDNVFAQDGSVTEVSGVYQRGLQQCFEFIFNDRSSIVVDWEHLWTVQFDYNRNKLTTGRGNTNYNYKKWVTIPTYKIIAKTGLGKINIRTKRGQFIIPSIEPLQYPHQQVPLSSYELGLLLGDGSLSKATPYLHTADLQIVNYLKDNGWTYRIDKRNLSKNQVYCCGKKGVGKIIRQLGLHGKRSWEKFIPQEYLFNSTDVRFSLLQGLMDTDGTVSKEGIYVTYSTTSEKLARDVTFLVRSLGGRVIISNRFTHYRLNGVYKTGRRCYQLQIAINENLFRLLRKKERFVLRKRHINKIIREIRSVGVMPTICIKIKHPSGLYIAKDFIVTHNTSLLLNIVKENMREQEIHYFNSEMGPPEMKERLSKFDDINLNDWKFTTYERSGNFADVVKPNAVNIIDFLEIHDNFYLIGQEIKNIWDRLEKGIAFIAIQKNPGQDLGRGGTLSLEKPRLYLAMDGSRVKIVKAKNWRGHQNPNGLIKRFKLVQGAKFIEQSGWEKEE